MRVVVLCCLCCTAAAQQSNDALKLLQQTAASARAMNSFRAQGRIAIEINGKPGAASNFTFTMKRPRNVRVSVDGANEAVSVCDGTTRWLSLLGMKTYSRMPPGSAACAVTAMNWDRLTDGAASVIAGPQTQIQFNGAPLRCQMLNVRYGMFPGLAYTPNTPALTNASNVKRTLWIDPARSWVVQDRVEAAYAAGSTVVTTTYTSIEANPVLAADLFTFQPPPGSSESGSAAPAGAATPPQVITNKNPEYTESARRDKVEGSVLLSVTVGPDGIPSQVSVLRSLQPDLDEKAIEAVNQWRFRPGTKNGAPVAVRATIEINFRLINDLH